MRGGYDWVNRQPPEAIGELYHIGFLVRDMAAAREELGAILGVDFHPIGTGLAGEWLVEGCWSIQGPPYIELLLGPPGSPWNIAEGSRLDHIAYVVDDLAEGRAKLEALGVAVELDGVNVMGHQMYYHRAPHSGLRVEIVDRSAVHTNSDLQTSGIRNS